LEVREQTDDLTKVRSEVSQIAESVQEMNEATAMLVTGAVAQAAFQLEKGVGKHPNHCDLWHAYGHTLRDQGNLHEAVEAYRKAIDLALRYHPLIHFESSAQHLQRAMLHLQMREEERAKHDLQHALFQDHGNQAALHLQAHGWDPNNPPPIYDKNLMTETAWHHETSRIQSELYQLQSHQQEHDKAIYFFRHNNMRAAFVIINDLLKQRPDYPMAWHHRALMFLHIGETRQAYDDLNMAITRAESWHDGYHRGAALHHLHCGQALVELNQKELALNHYTKALQLEKNFALIYVEQAKLQAENGQMPTAIASIDEALTRDPRQEWQELRQGWIKQMGG
jgi:tetratricopeptide (TPR) repeat protein